MTVAPGAKLEVLRDGKRVCNLLIASVTAGEALGKIDDMERGAKLDLGDKITVRLPK